MIYSVKRRMPIGAEALPNGGVCFRVWAPIRERVELVLISKSPGSSPERRFIEMARDAGGFFSRVVHYAAAGDLYTFRLDGMGSEYPDPASRFQPKGPHDYSEVVDPSAFQWTDHEWKGVDIEGQIIYELHVGTFTPEGTYNAAEQQLPALVDLGITVVEFMPLADFPGTFGWGYDGVHPFAPTRLYGRPDDLRRFVNTAHSLGIGVILDVVYNHLGPDGNYLKQFTDEYFTTKYKTHWGEAINFDGAASEYTRQYFVENAAYWITEYHLDGLRIDATPEMKDASPNHILKEITLRARAAAGRRKIIIIGENETQDVKLIQSAEESGYGLDALWSDDLHHSAMALLTGRNEAYYMDYVGKPQEFISCVKWGYLYQGQRYKWHKGRRGTPTFGIKPAAFVNFLQNHDQVANSAKGDRIHKLCGLGRLKAMTALLLLGPGTPLLFQGQEFAASQPFLYFADNNSDLTSLVDEGRKVFLAQFPSMSTPEGQALIAPPHEPETFRRCVLDFSERESHREMYELHKDLICLRKSHAAFRAQEYRGVEGAVLSSEAFVLRYFAPSGMDTILLVNFGVDLHLDPAPEPLLAPPLGMEWVVLWSSEDPKYGGTGTPALDTEHNWLLIGHAAVALVPRKPEGGLA